MCPERFGRPILPQSEKCGTERVKRSEHFIAFSLTLMFGQHITVAYVPDECKLAVVTPVHKKGPTY